MAACGLSVSLFSDADGTGKRESWRQCLFAVIQPLGRLVETELQEKAGRARYQALLGRIAGFGPTGPSQELQEHGRWGNAD